MNIEGNDSKESIEDLIDEISDSEEFVSFSGQGFKLGSN